MHDNYKHATMVTSMQADPTASDIAHVHTVSARFGRVYASHLLRSQIPLRTGGVADPLRDAPAACRPRHAVGGFALLRGV